MKLLYVDLRDYDRELWLEYDNASSLLPTYPAKWRKFLEIRMVADLGLLPITPGNSSKKIYQICQVVDDNLATMAVLSSRIAVWEFNERSWETIKVMEPARKASFTVSEEFADHYEFIFKWKKRNELLLP